MKNIESQIKSALSREPDFELSAEFTDRLVSMMVAAKRKEERLEIFWIGLGAFLFLITLIVWIVLTDFKISLSSFPFLRNHLGLVCFGIVFITLLNWLDKKLVRKNSIRSINYTRGGLHKNIQ